MFLKIIEDSKELSSCRLHLLTITTLEIKAFKNIYRDFLGGPVVKNLPANAGAQVRPLAWEDPLFPGATKPMYHNY